MQNTTTHPVTSLIGMRNKPVFICQLFEGNLRLIKCAASENGKTVFLNLAHENLNGEDSDKELYLKLENLIKKLGYKDNPFIFCLPRNAATSRYIRIPAQRQEELEDIVSLQASRFLPYPQENLITGYHVISQNSGYSDLNLIVLEKNTIDRYLKICSRIKIKNFQIFLSSYGLNGLSNYLKIEGEGPVMVMDIDLQNAELAIIDNKKLLFSRSFRLPEKQDNSLPLFIASQIRQTVEGYTKELHGKLPQKLIIFHSDWAQRLSEALPQELNLPVAYHNYLDKIRFTGDFSQNIQNFRGSPASLIGLGLNKPLDTLNLVPQAIKEKRKKSDWSRKRLNFFIFICSIILVWGLGIREQIENKKMLLQNLKIKTNAIAKEARPLELISKRLNLSGSNPIKFSALEQLGGLYQLVPADIFLTGFKFEKNKSLVITGESPQINPVFTFSKNISSSDIFIDYNIKVNYLSRKIKGGSETTEFEILCLKKKGA